MKRTVDCANMEQNGLIPNKKQRLIAKNPVTVVLGTQWGDEGKGKIVDMIASDADICCRCQVRFLQFINTQDTDFERFIKIN